MKLNREQIAVYEPGSLALVYNKGNVSSGHTVELAQVAYPVSLSCKPISLRVNPVRVLHTTDSQTGE